MAKGKDSGQRIMPAKFQDHYPAYKAGKIDLKELARRCKRPEMQMTFIVGFYERQHQMEVAL